MRVCQAQYCINFAGRVDVLVRAENLLHQSGPGSEHADDEDGLRRVAAFEYWNLSVDDGLHQIAMFGFDQAIPESVDNVNEKQSDKVTATLKNKRLEAESER